MKRVAALALVLLLCDCGHQTAVESRPPPTLPASALPGLNSRTRSLDAAAIAVDVGWAALKGVLQNAGYIAGSEREFFGRTQTFTHVVARVLLFRDPSGAMTLLAWLRSHADVVLGRAVKGEALPLGESPMLFSLGSCGCHAEVPTFFAAWQRGATVFWLVAAGPGATRAAIGSLALTFDRDAG